MDMSIILSLIAIFLPAIYAIYLFIARLSLTPINKFILNNGCVLTSLIASLIFIFLAFNIQDRNIVGTFFNIDFNNLDFNFEYNINKNNIYFLIYSCIAYGFVSLFSKKYFSIKKQFIFTKQRFFIFLSLLFLNTNLFLISSNLIQCLFCWLIQGVLVHIFSYFDIFKHPTNHNMTRFNKISLLGDFAFILSCLILFKYAILSNNYIEFKTLEFNELNELISYMYGLSENYEFFLCLFGFLIATATKLAIFPMNSYYSFFANSSNVFYLACANCSNLIFGSYIFIKLSIFYSLIENIEYPLKIYFATAASIALFCILFEKNIKIIFGYYFSFINSIFVILFLNNKNINTLYIFLILNFILIIVLSALFIKDKTNLKKRIFNVKGFIIERMHIFISETLPEKLGVIFNFIDEKIIKKVIYIPSYTINLISCKFLSENSKTTIAKTLANTSTIYVIFTLFAIFIALFGRYKY